ncbi:MAG: hypothetical protein WC540_05720 [Sulfuritalea sp.]
MQSCLKAQHWAKNRTLEGIMKALFFSMALAAGLALWGAEPQAGVDHLMAASHVAGQQVYNILH